MHISVKWVDVNKGGDFNPNNRSRLVAGDIRLPGEKAVFAPTPPLETLRTLLSAAATRWKNAKKKHIRNPESEYRTQISVIDVSRAYLNAKRDPDADPVYVDLPHGDPDNARGMVGLLLVGGLGFALHRELRHRGHTLTRTLEAIRLGRPPDPLPKRSRDEFSEALEVAGTLGRELDRMRRVGGDGELTLDDPRAIEDLTSATRLRTLAQIYRALAHELRAPLQAMSLHIDSLRDHLDHPGEPAEQSQRDVNTLATELKRLDQSLLAVLSETAPEREEASVFDLRALVLEVEELLAAQSRRQGVKFESALPDDPVRIRGHRNRVKQALLNVVMNAFEVQPGGGTVAVAVEAAEETAQLQVEDAGPGISEAAQGRIFDLHFSTKEHGTGIGLTVARAVVEATGGQVEVGQAPRGGAAIRFRFPMEGGGADA